MASRDFVSACVRSVLEHYASLSADDKSVEEQTVFDDERGHYLLVTVGWPDDRRVYHTSVHIDVKDGKAWIQCNRTELNVAEDLVEQGLSRADIVLGFQMPFKRPYTDYAVG